MPNLVRQHLCYATLALMGIMAPMASCSASDLPLQCEHLLHSRHGQKEDSPHLAAYKLLTTLDTALFKVNTSYLSPEAKPLALDEFFFSKPRDRKVFLRTSFDRADDQPEIEIFDPGHQPFADRVLGLVLGRREPLYLWRDEMRSSAQKILETQIQKVNEWRGELDPEAEVGFVSPPLNQGIRRRFVSLKHSNQGRTASLMIGIDVVCDQVDRFSTAQSHVRIISAEGTFCRVPVLRSWLPIRFN